MPIEMLRALLTNQPLTRGLQRALEVLRRRDRGDGFAREPAIGGADELAVDEDIREPCENQPRGFRIDDGECGRERVGEGAIIRDYVNRV